MNKLFSCVFILALLFSCKKKEQGAEPIVTPITKTPNSGTSNTLEINEGGKVIYKNIGPRVKLINTKDGSIYILTNQFQDSLRVQLVLIKATSAGNEIWRHTFGELGDDEIGGLIASNDGGVIVGSSWMTIPSFNPSMQSIRLTKYTADGNLVFDKKYNFQEDTDLQDIVETTTNNIIGPNGHLLG